MTTGWFGTISCTYRGSGAGNSIALNAYNPGNTSGPAPSLTEARARATNFVLNKDSGSLLCPNTANYSASSSCWVRPPPVPVSSTRRCSSPLPRRSRAVPLPPHSRPAFRYASGRRAIPVRGRLPRQARHVRPGRRRAVPRSPAAPSRGCGSAARPPRRSGPERGRASALSVTSAPRTRHQFRRRGPSRVEQRGDQPFRAGQRDDPQQGVRPAGWPGQERPVAETARHGEPARSVGPPQQVRAVSAAFRQQLGPSRSRAGEQQHTGSKRRSSLGASACRPAPEPPMVASISACVPPSTTAATRTRGRRALSSG